MRAERTNSNFAVIEDLDFVANLYVLSAAPVLRKDDRRRTPGSKDLRGSLVHDNVIEALVLIGARIGSRCRICPENRNSKRGS